MANAGPGTNGESVFYHTKKPLARWETHVFGRVVTEGQSVVDSIAQNDTIIGIGIICKRSDAKKFDATTIFENYF